jgi:hypothetical protein
VNTPTVVAIYARVSLREQNPEVQLLALREYALQALIAEGHEMTKMPGIGPASALRRV